MCEVASESTPEYWVLRECFVFLGGIEVVVWSVEKAYDDVRCLRW